MALFLRMHPENPSERHINQIVDILKNGGVIIYPTDTVYGIGCDITKQKAIEKVALIKGIRPEKANFSFICYDLSHISDFTKPLNNTIFKLMKRNLPGPFTFILEANNNVPKILKANRKSIGIRVPNNNIIREIVKNLGNPILTSSLKTNDEIIEYNTDPELIFEEYENIVDAVIDGGYGGLTASTIIDCTNSEPEIIRLGSIEPEF
ncbi:MAG: threonylcarbamoyl-AMP synthase [Bacteroidales bacterium]|jgi:tRNA threonylcarbamoyl adenosine modification protein (Sua5/YciO/YrdC/YwlC family)|nr:L-threonylcarbamoyladenylate synthase [Bacteroidales bacterium]MCK9499433.1 L-threonylcarbamoyladenylate synthase [Bacteroidales bacterium]MDY0313925.1 L-threonylcarbamoyladenylate synthase [Bacteroidales bacterium]NLB86807.1 threonylcarbamoyl-AMP synthase [Bacteroidales bacterium]